ncbi:MAG: hypothetical protein FWE99_03800, partial [Bacteroidales bacterium]|nr:hypothetical protein [Bacteroidales bacterium]
IFAQYLKHLFYPLLQRFDFFNPFFGKGDRTGSIKLFFVVVVSGLKSPSDVSIQCPTTLSISNRGLSIC